MRKKNKTNPPNHEAHNILNSIADGVFTVDREMTITHFNKSAERITCIPVRHALGKYCYEVLRSNICESKCPLRWSIDTGENVINQQNTILNADSLEIPISLSTAVIRDESGKVLGGVETFRDLSNSEPLEKENYTENSFDDNGSKSQRTLESLNIIELVGNKNSSELYQSLHSSAGEFPLLKHAEKYTIIEVLKKNNWNIMKTAGELGIDRTTLWRKMKKFNISKS